MTEYTLKDLANSRHLIKFNNTGIEIESNNSGNWHQTLINLGYTPSEKQKETYWYHNQELPTVHVTMREFSKDLLRIHKGLISPGMIKFHPAVEKTYVVLEAILLASE